MKCWSRRRGNIQGWFSCSYAYYRVGRFLFTLWLALLNSGCFWYASSLKTDYDACAGHQLDSPPKALSPRSTLPKHLHAKRQLLKISASSATPLHRSVSNLSSSSLYQSAIKQPKFATMRESELGANARSQSLRQSMSVVPRNQPMVRRRESLGSSDLLLDLKKGFTKWQVPVYSHCMHCWYYICNMYTISKRIFSHSVSISLLCFKFKSQSSQPSGCEVFWMPYISWHSRITLILMILWIKIKSLCTMSMICWSYLDKVTRTCYLSNCMTSKTECTE